VTVRQVKQQSDADGDGRLVDGLVQVAFMTTALLSKIAGKYDLSLTQLRVLGILRDRRLRMSVLADFLGLEKSTLSGLVDRAEQRGLLERVPDSTDGRSVEVFLSPAGMVLASRIVGQVNASLQIFTESLDAPSRQHLQTLLERMLER
jgi:DNA-binding MarR family transcriptional regulator